MAAHRLAQLKLLDGIKHHIAEGEAELLKALDDEDRRRLIDKIAGLHITQQRIEAALTDGGKPVT